MPKLQPLPTLPDFAQLETEIQKFWQATKAFERSVSIRPASKPYVFYDGPPFATGLPHYGHLLASTTKDVIPRYWTMKGYRVERVWGWDCHGLPIENMIEEKLEIKGGKKGIEELGIDRFNAACRAEVLRLDTEWEKTIGRLGRWVDFQHNYKTMDTTFMESVWWGFQQLHQKKLVYEGRKVILYCPRCSTPLSNFEIAMDNSYREVTDRGTTYKYRVTSSDDATANRLPTFFLAWSTTPWNKLVTPALAVSPTMSYLKIQQDGTCYIVAESRVNQVIRGDFQIIERYQTGVELEKLRFEPHFDFYPHRQSGEQWGVVVADPFVTADEGTGVVTLAVYGEDDYRIMRQRNIQCAEHVDDEGRLKPEITPWAGMFILKADRLINESLAARDLIYDDQPHQHSVPTCYRCNTRLYYAPLPAWFIDISQLRPQLLTANQNINWVPNHLKHGRFQKGLENAPDWNISRSRYWGTPMPVWRGTRTTDTGETETLTRVIGSIAELQTWAVHPEQAAQLSDIHRESIDQLQVWVDDKRTVIGHRIPEVFDCWVESGSMPFAALHYPFENKAAFEAAYPAQFVSEYIAQTRAWFYTMHVLSVALFGKHPFENVLTTGTILAEDGSKMSKSKKNYPDPQLLIDAYGVDSLRLYLMSSTVMKSENLHFSEKEVADIRRKVFVIWWNVLSFYLQFANTEAGTSVKHRPDHILDQWLLSRYHRVLNQVTEYMDAYEVVRASRTLMQFVAECSTWYVRLSRERIKQSNNQETSQIFGHVLYGLAQLFAPLTPFFSEVVHHHMIDDSTSIHHSDWPTYHAEHYQADLEQEMALVQKIVEQGHAERKQAGIKVRQPLSEITVITQTPTRQAALAELIKQELNVKSVVWIDGDPNTPDDVDVKLNLTLTDELRAEGQARDIMRDIQKLRKTHQLSPNDQAEIGLPEWPIDWQATIEHKTNSKLTTNDQLTLKKVLTAAHD